MDTQLGKESSPTARNHQGLGWLSQAGRAILLVNKQLTEHQHEQGTVVEQGTSSCLSHKIPNIPSLADLSDGCVSPYARCAFSAQY